MIRKILFWILVGLQILYVIAFTGAFNSTSAFDWLESAITAIFCLLGSLLLGRYEIGKKNKLGYILIIIPLFAFLYFLFGIILPFRHLSF